MNPGELPDRHDSQVQSSKLPGQEHEEHGSFQLPRPKWRHWQTVLQGSARLRPCGAACSCQLFLWRWGLCRVFASGCSPAATDLPELNSAIKPPPTKTSFLRSLTLLCRFHAEARSAKGAPQDVGGFQGLESALGWLGCSSTASKILSKSPRAWPKPQKLQLPHARPEGPARSPGAGLPSSEDFACTRLPRPNS